MPSKEDKKHPVALFLGNGINCVDKNVEWNTLIRNMIAFAQVEKEVDLNDKPFPLLYEEIVLASAAKGIKNEAEVKQYIAAEMKSMAANDIHKLVAEKSLAEIITTNYDHSLETALGLENIVWNCNEQTERKYNIFRLNKTAATRLWHIHGDAGAFQSITLGYEQYSGQLQRMRGYVATGTGESYKKNYTPLIRTLQKGEPLPGHSWLELFFTHEIHILGFSLDFVEIDLWWLLSYRARAFYLEKLIPRLTPVIYYYPESLAKKLATRLSLMKRFGITVISRSRKGKEYYHEILQGIKK